MLSPAEPLHAAGDRERACMPAASRTKLALLLGTAGSSVTAVFWSWALHKMVAEYGWKLGWRPDLLWMPTCESGAARSCLLP